MTIKKGGILQHSLDSWVNGEQSIGVRFLLRGSHSVNGLLIIYNEASTSLLRLQISTLATISLLRALLRFFYCLSRIYDA